MKTFRTIFLDLDDTLYPHSCGIWPAIGERINAYIRDRLRVPTDQVAALRDGYFRAYGTTLQGLIIHYGIDPMDYLDYVHQVPIEHMLDPNPALDRMLAGLPQQRVILTNASRAHAERVLERLGIGRHIERIIDITALGYVNKPAPEAYHRALELAGEQEASASLVIDDSVRNLQTAGSLGMTTVLVSADHAEAPVDFRIDCITQLLEALPGLAAPTLEG
jgi:putative hydrolase of the HAD superfamily